jgi:Mrp family chromosome partitioning ATPase
MTDVAWQELDVLLVDTPPGTSDEHITVMENLRPLLSTTQHVEAMSGAVLVTTPQAVAVGDVRREITFCKKANLKVRAVKRGKW